MKLDEIFESRRSIRSFSRKPIARQDVFSLIHAARIAPSACNSQTWRFVVVSRLETIRHIAQTAMRPIIPNRWLADVPLLIVGCSQLDIIANRVGRKFTGTDYYQIDLGIAMEHMVLKATELGLGTCWIGWFREDRIKQILDIPSRIKVSAMLAVGYPKAPLSKARGRKSIQEIAFSERWNQPIE